MLLQNIFGPLRSKYLVAEQQLCLHRGFALIPTSSEKAEAAVVNRKLYSAYNRELCNVGMDVLTRLPLCVDKIIENLHQIHTFVYSEPALQCLDDEVYGVNIVHHSVSYLPVQSIMKTRVCEALV